MGGERLPTGKGEEGGECNNRLPVFLAPTHPPEGSGRPTRGKSLVTPSFPLQNVVTLEIFWRGSSIVSSSNMKSKFTFLLSEKAGGGAHN